MSIALLNTLPVSTKPTTPRLRQTGIRSSALKMTSALPPIGMPFWSSVRRRAELVRAAKPRTVVSPPAKKRSLAGRSCTISGRPFASSTGRPFASSTGRGKPVASPRRASPAKTMPCARGSVRKSSRGHERLRQADLRADRAAGELAVDARVGAARRVDRIVARVANRRRRERRQPDLRKHPVDEQGVVLADVLVEHVDLLDLVVAGDADLARQFPRRRSTVTLRREKSKVDRSCCSTVAVTTASAEVSNSRGSR